MLAAFFSYFDYFQFHEKCLSLLQYGFLEQWQVSLTILVAVILGISGWEV